LGLFRRASDDAVGAGEHFGHVVLIEALEHETARRLMGKRGEILPEPGTTVSSSIKDAVSPRTA
jgi:hypothetical protein